VSWLSVAVCRHMSVILSFDLLWVTTDSKRFKAALDFRPSGVIFFFQIQVLRQRTFNIACAGQCALYDAPVQSQMGREKWKFLLVTLWSSCQRKQDSNKSNRRDIWTEKWLLCKTVFYVSKGGVKWY